MTVCNHFPRKEDMVFGLDQEWRDDLPKVRWRAIRDETADMLAGVLAGIEGDEGPDADSHLVAHLMATAWTAPMMQGQASFRTSQNAQAAEKLFPGSMDKAAAGLTTAMAGTPCP